MIEAVLILPVMMASIVLLFYAAYRSLIYFYADAALHEAMICTDSQSLSSCEQDLKNQLRPVLLDQENPEVRLSKTGSGKSYRLHGEIIIKNKILIRKEMKFPLKGFT
jgi:hypothetical protein